jgi:hypothetical protein
MGYNTLNYTEQGGDRHVIGGELDVVGGSLKQNGADILNKPITPTKVWELTDSIGGYGTLPQLLASKLNATVINSAYTANQVSSALVETADEWHIPMKGGNQVARSNDMTTSWNQIEVTATKATLKDGTVWNKITKTTANASKGIMYDSITTWPASGATGVFFSLEVYIPETSENPIKSLNVVIMELTTFKAVNNVYTDLQSGTRYKICKFIPASNEQVAGWGTANNKSIRILLNNGGSGGDAIGTCYIRNVEVSFTAPNAYENYVPTNGTVVAPADTAVVTKCDMNKYALQNVDVALCCFGRNEAVANVDPYSLYRAFDKLLNNCNKFAPLVIPFNCPPLRDKTGSGNAWSANDNYVTSGYNKLFNRLMAKYNTGVNTFELIKKLVDEDGKYTQSEIYGTGDDTHLNAVGGEELANELAKQIVSGRRINNYARPEMSGTSKFYAPSTKTGTWTLNLDPVSVFAQTLAMYNDVSFGSSTQNDTLTWSNIQGEQLHIMYRVDTTYGTFDVIVDEGTGTERKFTINSAFAGVTNWRMGIFLCDYLEAGNHTVKVKVTSSGKPVNIMGILAV